MCKNSKNGWGFRAKGVENLAVPFLNSARAKGDKWLLLGALPDESLIDVQFTKPYIDKKSSKCFWRFSDGISYLRPFLRTSFFGQWFYAIMVGLYGLNNASVLLGDEYRNYFKESVKTMVQYFDYMKYDAEIFGSPSFLQRSIGLKDLDSIGTVGMNMADFYKMTEDSDAKAVLRVLSDAVKENIPTFDDGTFHREKTMWADDLYMSCPFLVRMGEIEKNKDYFDECIRQIEGFKKRLYNEDEKIFSHIYFLEDEKKNNVPWGRGNGWIFFTLSELLLKLPSSEKKAGIAKLFSEFSEGVRTLQGKSGMWHQVLNDNSTYRETSCTAMFILGLVRGIKNGWIDRSYLETVEKAWQGLFENAVDFDGNIWGVCRGSGCSYDSKYYAELSTVVNDDHGTGVVLAALCETILLERDI